MAISDNDQEALAAEYVLGTLSVDERERAEALRSLDAVFEAAVRQWERRLGELNVMVEAVEPPAQVWDKIKTTIGSVELGGETASRGEHESLPTVATLASGLVPPASEAETLIPIETPAQAPPVSPPVAESEKLESGADVIRLRARIKRWQGATLALGAIAALLALYVAVWQVAPDRIPPQLRPRAAGMLLAQSQAPPVRSQDRLVAVLQQEPTAPAFLLTVDPQNRRLVVRRVSAKPEAGKSYELWLISSRFPAPRSLGIVSNDEFTERTLPASYDLDTLRSASYAVSLEPLNGSPSGTPTGPVLFTGKTVEALPASSPAKPTMPRT
jgi:anti-sigma-K factor RskA